MTPRLLVTIGCAVACLGVTAPLVHAAEPSTATAANLGRLTAHTANSCAIKTNGDAQCWGYRGDNVATVAGGASDVREISVGPDHGCLVRTDDTAVCFGGGANGQASAPSDLGPVRTVAAGRVHSCVVKADGGAACWGSDVQGQSTVPAGLDPLVSISAGSEHTCALQQTGVPVCWGRNNEGQTTIPSGLGTVAAVYAMGQHSCAIKTDRSVACWGFNAAGQATVPGDLGTVEALAGDLVHTCAVTTSGAARCWGDDSFGQATPPPGLGRVVAIAAGAAHSCVTEATGDIVCWGGDYHGQATPPAGSATWSATPSAPVLTAFSPTSPGSSLTPKVIGTAWDDTLVFLYPTANCGGIASGGGPSTDFVTGGVALTVPADTTTAVSAKVQDQAGNLSTCSNSLTYSHVTPPLQPAPPTESAPPLESPPPVLPVPPLVPITGPATIPPTARTCAALPRANRAGIGLTATLAGRKLTIVAHGRGKAKVRVTMQSPCGKRRTISARTLRLRGALRRTLTVPKPNKGTILTVRVALGRKTATKTLTLRG